MISEQSVKEAGKIIRSIIDEAGQVLVGQKSMIEKILIGFFTGGHILLEGVPGLAKTLAVKTMAGIMGLEFSRIQFTPDLLPADILGTQIYNQKTGSFSTRKGPLFSSIILADEINRAPSKVQSALLEAMQEKQITIGEETFSLTEPYIVLATQNPIEQEGTYPLPEAQIDRFMLKILVNYPVKKEEKEIIRRMSVEFNYHPKSICDGKTIMKLRKLAEEIYIDEKLIDYIIDIIFATRQPEKYGLDKSLIAFGASPRASIYLAMASKAHALLQGENYVKTEDIKSIAYDVLRHRVIVSYEAEAEGIKSEDLIKKIFDTIETP
ncbi:MAG: ATPase [Spirochaetes bacterium GWF1_41_5]|nr:MAG: ATPase [Spirochaetes bacterium GWF1_41_5]HBE04016.1 ATPase [Spirochaetia bacterium]